MRESIKLRQPAPDDGMALHELVARCRPLDENSLYCNLLQASHFAQTGVAAVREDRLVGFVSGYCVPDAINPTWFVWQVAVDESARGLGLAKQMLHEVLARPHMANIAYIETSITHDNQASWALFRSLARQLEAPLHESVLFDHTEHFNGQHDTEYLVRIGPLPSR